MHRVDAPSSVSFRAIDELPPGERYWFVALVWRSDGEWDFAWSKEGGLKHKSARADGAQAAYRRRSDAAHLRQ